MQCHPPARLPAPKYRLSGYAGSRRRDRLSWLRSSFFNAPLPALFAVLPLLLILAAPKAAFPVDDASYHVREVKPNVYVWIAEDILDQEGDPQFNRAGNAGFIITHDGVVVVNTTNSPFNARALLFEIRKRTHQPIRYVINTSASPDMMLGNESFVDFKPIILSTPAAAEAMRNYKKQFPLRESTNWQYAASMRGVHPTPPTQTFGDVTTLQVGGVEIKLINLGDNITPGDAAVYLPQSKVVFLGNVFENEYVPRIGAANINRWIGTLKKVESWNADVYIPGHGQPGGKAQVAQFRQFLKWLSGQVGQGLKKGMSLSKIQNALVPFQGYHWHAPELETDAVAGVYHFLVKSKDKVASSGESPSP